MSELFGTFLCLTGQTKLNHGNESYSLLLKAAGLGTDHTSPFNEVGNGRSSTSTSHYLFMAFCITKHSKNLTLPVLTRLHDMTFRETVILIFSVVRTSVAMATVSVSRILLVMHVVICICYEWLRNNAKVMLRYPSWDWNGTRDFQNTTKALHRDVLCQLQQRVEAYIIFPDTSQRTHLWLRMQPYPSASWRRLQWWTLSFQEYFDII